MRLFIAAQLSEEMKSSITGTMHELKKAGVRGSYAPAQNLHLTLAFIGETEDAATVKEAFRAVSFRPFRLALSDMGCFGDLVWVGLKGNQGLSAVVKSVRDALDSAGIDYDKKKFTPHITIIRKASGRWQQVQAPRGEMMVRRISLMKSEQKDGKQVYTELLGQTAASSS